MIHDALKNGELITNPDDDRKYQGATTYSVKIINGVATPVSNPDGRQTNNLG